VRVHDRVIISNNPVNFTDPTGLQNPLPPGVGFGIKQVVNRLIIGPQVQKIIQDPAGSRIISNAISGALVYGTLGAIGGAAGGSAFFGVGALPGAIIGGLGGSISGFTGGLLGGTLGEVGRSFFTNSALESVCPK